MTESVTETHVFFMLPMTFKLMCSACASVCWHYTFIGNTEAVDSILCYNVTAVMQIYCWRKSKILMKLSTLRICLSVTLAVVPLPS